jgi:hypothetical protein
MSTTRFDRQIRLFGEEGQEKIENVKVAVVGLGGLGSHVAQQLAYLGVRRFGLIDGDNASESNLNRLIGAGPSDVGRAKVDVAERLVKRIAPEAITVKQQSMFVTRDGFRLIREADVAVGCVDNDGSRFILNEVCQAYEIPYLDVATDVSDRGDTPEFGGRLLFSIGGERCLICDGLLDQDALSAAFATEGQRAEEARTYGVPREVLGGRGPSVVSVNGIVASLAVTELMVYVTGYRPVRTHLEYRGAFGQVFSSGPYETKEECYYCNTVRGAGDEADVNRYIEEAVG